MFIPGSVKSSKWGYDVWKPTSQYWYSTITSVTSTVGCWSAPTLAPNGKIYCLPTTNTINGTTPLDGVLIITPGEGNTSIPTVSFKGSGGVDNPSIPLASTSPGTQNRYLTKGILAPNGLIYFCPGSNNANFLILNPEGGDNPTWEIKPFNTISGVNATGASFAGGVLGTDGCIYLIPVGTQTCRIKPRNTSINESNIDIYEVGYWDGSTGKSWSTGGSNGYASPQSLNATTRTVVLSTDPSVPQQPISKGSSLRDAIVHPNGNIYIFPCRSDSTSRFIFVIRPQKGWTTVESIASLPSLGMPNATGILGTASNIFLEKPKAGQELSTLKMYGTFRSRYAVGSLTDSKQKSFVFDPVTNNIQLIGDVFDKPTSSQSTAAISSFQLANGMIVASTGLISTLYPNNQNIGQVIITGKDVKTNIVSPITSNIVCNFGESRFTLLNVVTDQGSNVGTGSGIPIISNKGKGKTLISGNNSGAFLTSIKGYHPNVRYFSYNENYGGFQTSIYTLDNLTVNFTSGFPLSSFTIEIEGVNLTSVLIQGAPFIISGSSISGNNKTYTAQSNSTYNSVTDSTTVSVFEPVTTETGATIEIKYGQLVKFPSVNEIQIWGLGTSISNVNTYSNSYTISGGVNDSITATRDLNTVPVFSSPVSNQLGSVTIQVVNNSFTTTSTYTDAQVSWNYMNNDSEIYEIPSDLTNLPNSMWNRYFNKPC